MVPIIKIVDWEKHYENNRPRELKKMAWVPMPNRHDGDGYTRLLDHPNGTAHFGAWCALVEVASRCDVRGTLLRRGGDPIESESLARMTHIPLSVWNEVLPRLVTIGWISIYIIPQEGAGFPQEGAPAPHPSAMEWNGREGNGREEDSLSGAETSPDPVSTLVDKQALEKEPVPYVAIINLLNRTAHTSFRSESDQTRRFIKARWNEGFRLQDFERVIGAKTAQWMRDPKMISFLRPQTLFGPKFEAYLNESVTAAIAIPCIECGLKGGQHKYDCSKSRTAEIERASLQESGEPAVVDNFEDDTPEAAP